MATDTAMSTTSSLPPTASISIPSTSTTPKPERLPVTVTKPTPYTFDLGHLLLHDPNPLPPHPTLSDLSTTARDCAQVLINQLLTTCPLTNSPLDGILLTLPPGTFPLPREKPLPPAKEKTKWEKFAAKKGISVSSTGKKGGKDGTAGKMVYDEAKGEWVPKWGYKGKNKEGEGEWIVEVDEKKEREVQGRGDGSGVRGEGRRERVERVRRNERRERANGRRGRKGGMGVGT